MNPDEIKKMLKNENLILGSDRVVKLLRENQMSQVFLASNAPADVAEDIKRYAGLTGAAVEALNVPNDELGVLCKKPFNIAVIGLKKASQTAKKRH